MSPITLTKTETKHLLDAAGEGGVLALPDSLKPASRERLLGRYLRDGLVQVTDDGTVGHRLTPAGYRAVGLRPTRARPIRTGETGGAASSVVPEPSTRDRVLDLLRREEGASLAELMAATSWLPHTTRAALSRLRSGGEPVLRFSRDDGSAYRIVPAAPPADRKRQPKTASETVAA